MSLRLFISFGLAIGMLFILEFKHIYDTDIFWQVRLGRIMLDEGRIPLSDPFTYTHSGEPTTSFCWLGQALFALIYNLGGWHLTRIVHHLTLVASVLLAAATCRTEKTSPLSLAIAITIGFFIILLNADLRLQSLGLFGFAATLALARSTLPYRLKLIVLPCLLIVWQNIYPSVSVGVIVLAALATANLGRHRIMQDLGLLAIAAVCQLATPMGTTVFEILRINVWISRDVLGVSEWAVPWDPRNSEAMVPFWIVLVLTSIAIIWRWKHLSIQNLALFVVLTPMPLYAVRFILFWAVGLIPLWAEIAEAIIPRGMFVWARDQKLSPTFTRRAIIGLASGLVLVLALHPARFRPILRPEIPTEGVEILRATLPDSARIYDDYPWAGPLLLDGSPGWRVSVDGRLYCFPNLAEWRTREDASKGRIPLEDLEQSHQPDAFVLDRIYSQPLIKSLSDCPRWRVCYTGPACIAFVRNPSPDSQASRYPAKGIP